MRGFHGSLAVLPELCMCGHLFPDRDALMAVAEEVPPGPTTRAMTELSAECGCTIVFGLAEKEGGAVYNTAVIVGNGEYHGKYRKVHLSDLEKKTFDRGTGNSIIDTGTCKVGVQICFDLWFPEISREQVKHGASVAPSKKDVDMTEIGEIEVGTGHSNVICGDFDAEMAIHPLGLWTPITCRCFEASVALSTTGHLVE